MMFGLLPARFDGRGELQTMLRMLNAIINGQSAGALPSRHRRQDNGGRQAVQIQAIV
jgi:hypothetical protein